VVGRAVAAGIAVEAGILLAVPAQRRLFRKITRGFDEKDTLLANALQRVEALEAQIEVIRPQKRRKVELSPNSKFADIEAIQRAQNKADRNEDSINEKSEAEISSDEEDCIVVGMVDEE
jgi:hypothetical protein